MNGLNTEQLFEEVANRAQAEYFPPNSPEEIGEMERVLGRPLPELLRRLYEVANGGFGPHYGLLGLVRPNSDDNELTVRLLYEGWRSASDDLGYSAWRWPEGMLPIAHQGCAVYSCVDTTRPEAPVFTFEPALFVVENDETGERPTTPEEFAALFLPEAQSLVVWLERWLDG